jgi:hypothetical protein
MITMGLFNSKAAERLIELRESGWGGPVDKDGSAVMSRTDRHGKSLPLFKGGTGHGTPDEKRASGRGKR